MSSPTPYESQADAIVASAEQVGISAEEVARVFEESKVKAQQGMFKFTSAAFQEYQAEKFTWTALCRYLCAPCGSLAV